MTNRTTQRPYSAGTAVKRPRLKRLEIMFEGAPPNTPEGLNNGTRPHGGYRGMKQLPPGQYSYNKDEAYVNEIDEDYRDLVNNENNEHHGAPYWVNDVQREVTHSGQSPLFTNKLLATGKFEQLHGCVSFERALLQTKTKRVSSPRRRHINGLRQFYRPNSTHQYLSATDLRNMQGDEENLIKYGRPTRTTLLRARQRSNSAPINAYDLRRESTKRIEEVQKNTVFCTSKDSFEREQARMSYRMYNVYANDGETMHSFLTGARYNRAHLLDSRGLNVYGVYMPRENPADCFIATNKQSKEDDIPSAPPDSPRSDLEETVTETIVTRPMSGVVHYRPVTTSVRPGSSKTGTGTGSKATSSRPPSHRITSSKSPGSRPRSGKESITSSFGQSSRRETLPDEITMAMPDHINKTGRGGVYVTLKGQKMLETVESKLPRVTGVSLPKIRKSRDHVDEMVLVNQPPPTPIDASMTGDDKTRPAVGDVDNDIIADHKAVETENVEGELVNGVKETDENKTANTQNNNTTNAETDKDVNALNMSKLTVSKNEMIDRETIEIGPTKHVNFSANEVTVISDKDSTNGDEAKPKVAVEADGKHKPNADGGDINDKVKFFVTEENEIETPRNDNTEVLDNGNSSDNSKSNDNDDGTELEEKNVDHVIKVEISETEKTE